MNELRQMERQRRGLNPQPLGDHPGRQTGRSGGDQQSEQRQPGFLSEPAEGGDRTFFIHNRCIPCFNNDQIYSASQTSRNILKIVEDTYPGCLQTGARWKDVDLTIRYSDDRLCEIVASRPDAAAPLCRIVSRRADLAASLTAGAFQASASEAFSISVDTCSRITQDCLTPRSGSR